MIGTKKNLRKIIYYINNVSDQRNVHGVYTRYYFLLMYVCSRSLDQIYLVIYHTKWLKTSWSDSTSHNLILFRFCMVSNKERTQRFF